MLHLRWQSTNLMLGLLIFGATAFRPALPPPALQSLRTTGYAVIEDFVQPAHVKLLKDDMAALQASGGFAVSGVGDAATNRVSDEVRRCEQAFLFPRLKYGGTGHADGRALLYDILDGVRGSLQEGTGAQLDPLLTEGIYACYPSGGYYRRHVDAVAGTPQALRKFSYLLYCNEGWTEDDGGCLRLYTDGGGEEAPAGAAPSYVDVEPKAGTLVVFRSDLVPHEVLDTTAPRAAVAGWFNSVPEGSGARRQLIGALAGALVVGGGLKTFLSGRAAAEKAAAEAVAAAAAAEEERLAAEAAAAAAAAAEKAAAAKAAAEAQAQAAAELERSLG